MPLREQGSQVWAGEGPEVGLLGAGMSCVGAARLVGTAAAPEVGLSPGSAPPSFPAISWEWGSPPQS